MDPAHAPLVQALEDAAAELKSGPTPGHPHATAVAGALPPFLVQILTQAVAVFGPAIAQAAIAFLQQFLPKPTTTS